MSNVIGGLAYIAVIAIGWSVVFGICVFVRWVYRVHVGSNMLFRAHDHLANHSHAKLDWGDWFACNLLLRKIGEL